MQNSGREFPLREHTLGNGLRIVLSEGHSVPAVAVAIYYDVGSRNEKPGRTGFAHLFEHMMFEGSENVPKTMHMKYVSASGGSMNGTTSEERTNYFEVLPSRMLPLGLWLEADRMKSLRITQENFENQRETVKEERRQMVDNQPYGEAWIKIRETALSNWTYSHPVIGSMEDLDSANAEDAQTFFHTYYAPNNAVLSIAGDFDPEQALRTIEEYFGDIPSSVPPDAVDVSEPLRKEEKRISITDPKIALPGLLMAYHIPPRMHPDIYAVRMLKQMLFDGKSARLYRRLIEKEEAAIECAGYVENSRGSALFPMWFISSVPDLERLKILVDEEIRRVIDGGITEFELERAKNTVQMEYVERIETCLGRALAIAEFKMFDNKPELINTELENYLEVTIDDVNRVAKSYLDESNRTVLEVLSPEPDAVTGGKA